MHNPALIFVALGDILTNCTGVGIPNTSIDIGHPKHLQVNPKFQNFLFFKKNLMTWIVTYCGLRNTHKSSLPGYKTFLIGG